MTDMSNTHFENQRQDELQAQHERNLGLGGHGAEDDGQPVYEDGKEPGHLGNDLSKMTLLDTDLAEIAEKGMDDREPNPEVQQALQDLHDIDTGPFPDEEKIERLEGDELRKVEEKEAKEREELHRHHEEVEREQGEADDRDHDDAADDREREATLEQRTDVRDASNDPADRAAGQH